MNGFEFEIVNVIIGIVSLGILIFTWIQNRQSNMLRDYEGRLFNALCLLAACESVATMFLTYLEDVDNKVLLAIDAFFQMTDGVLCTVLVLQWLIFLDYVLYHSRDHIRRTYRRAYVPIVICVVIEFLWSLFNVVAPKGMSGNDAVWTMPFSLIGLFIELYYLTASFRLVRIYHKNNVQPAFLKVNLFVWPFVAGYLLLFFTGYEFRILGVTVGILITWFRLKKRGRFLDEATGFYKPGYLPYAEAGQKGRGMEEWSVMVFETDGDAGVLAEVLKAFRPENSALMRSGSGQFLLAGSVREPSELRFIMDSVRDAVAEEEPGIEVRTSWTERNAGESAENYLRRIGVALD